MVSCFKAIYCLVLFFLCLGCKLDENGLIAVKCPLKYTRNGANARIGGRRTRVAGTVLESVLFCPSARWLRAMLLRLSFYCACRKYQAFSFTNSFLYWLNSQVIIITNSDEGWVHYSCEKFVPCLLPLIDNYRIVSARTAYEKFYPGQPLCWKAAAFAHEVNEYFENLSTHDENDDDGNTTSSGSLESEQSFDSGFSRESSDQREIISFGDSMEERTAVKIVADQLSAVPKSVMFVPSPSPVQIIGQLQLLTQHMRYICTHHDLLDLEITPEQARSFAETYIRRSKPDLRQAKDLSAMLITHTQEGMCAGN